VIVRIATSLLGAAALALAAAGALAAEADRMRDAFTKAYVTNPTLEAERARLRTVDEGVNQALSRSRPNVTFRATAGGGLFSIDRNSSSSNEGRTPLTSEVEVTQSLYSGGTNPATVDRAEQEILAARAGLLQTEQQIFLQAGRAFMNVVRDQAVVDLNRNNVTVLRRQLQATRDRFQVGEVTRTDVSQAEARLSGAVADLSQAEGDLASSRATYEEDVGERPGVLQAPQAYDKLPRSREEAIQVGSTSNPLVIQAGFNHLAAIRNVRAIHGELLPRADLVGRAGYSYEANDSDTTVTSGEALLQVTVPLYEAGSTRSRIREAKQLASQRLVEIEQARRKAVEEATIGWEQFIAARDRMRALEDEVRAQEIALDGVKQEALVGTRTVLDELNAEQELLNARVRLVESRRDQVVAALVLAVAVGILTADALELDVPRYDVLANYNAVRGRWLGTDIDNNWQSNGQR
jgi:outer membrane protein